MSKVRTAQMKADRAAYRLAHERMRCQIA